MNSHYAQYYLRQEGRGLSDIGTLYNAPLIRQRGRGGIGNFFSGAFNYLRPLFSSGIEALKSQAVKSGSAILDNVGKKPLKEVLKEQGKMAIEDLAIRGVNKLKRKIQGGSGVRKKRKIQGGSGGRRKRKNNIKSRRLTKGAHSTLKRKRVGKGKRKRKSVKQNRNKKSRVVDIFNN